jgi:hypothetical protein
METCQSAWGRTLKKRISKEANPCEQYWWNEQTPPDLYQRSARICACSKTWALTRWGRGECTQKRVASSFSQTAKPQNVRYPSFAPTLLQICTCSRPQKTGWSTDRHTERGGWGGNKFLSKSQNVPMRRSEF